MRIAIVGAGAAGCFCAINLKRRMPEAEVVVYESGTKPLAKVAITGGGRCNLTNSFAQVRSVQSVYPRGDKLMKRALKVFSHIDTMKWFEHEGVALVTQDDECVFPQSQDAMQIVMTLTRLMANLGVQLRVNSRVESIKELLKEYDRVVVTTGGSPRMSGLSMLEGLNLDIVAPVPSLFTFNIDDANLHSLMGTVVENVTARLVGTKIISSGPLLITHWGMSGPAILKLSAHGARTLADNDYRMQIAVNWMGKNEETGKPFNENDILTKLMQMQENNPLKQLSSIYPTCLVQRHWLYLIEKTGLAATKRWQEVGPKQMNRLASLLTNDTYDISGRGTFKDEFVTCGGVALSNISLSTLECKQHPGLFFAGEVLDVDAITGGFNLQAAWSMGYIVAQSI